jgi:hypothetical protein
LPLTLSLSSRRRQRQLFTADSFSISPPDAAAHADSASFRDTILRRFSSAIFAVAATPPALIFSADSRRRRQLTPAMRHSRLSSFFDATLSILRRYYRRAGYATPSFQLSQLFTIDRRCCIVFFFI